MRYRIERHGSDRAYMQLFYQMRGEILDGTLPVGTRLPSKRMLAAELELSVVTVEHAYELLSDEGYIEAKPRSGFYVCFGGRPSLPSMPRRKDE